MNTARMCCLTLSWALAASPACGDDASRGGATSTTDTGVAPDLDGSPDAMGPEADTAPDSRDDDATTAPDTAGADAAPEVGPDSDTGASDTGLADAAPPEPPCPAITVSEGLAVTPPTTLHLSGATTTGSVAQWRWTLVSAPAGLVSPFVPGTGVPEPRLEAALAGSYRIRLEAFDAKGQSACDPAEVTVVATPGAGLHLELVWDDNTSDPEVGADLDLHVFREDAVGLDTDHDGAPDGWFDPVFDCAWHNPTPTWPRAEGAPDPAPRLVRRDDAGYGPEVVVVPTPEATTYVVGFHVWDDEDAVYLAPTEIRVFIDSVLKNKPSFAVPVHAPSLERVMTVTWPSGQLGFPFADDGDFRPTTPSK